MQKSDGATDQQLEQLKEMRQMLVGGSDEPAKQLKLINDDDLCMVALRFRLLRQQGHHRNYLLQETEYFLARMILTKVICLTSVIDDIYDAYGTIEELILFTNAIQRFDALDWVSNNPLIVKACSVISRLTNDMAGHEFEKKRGHVALAVECYMKQHNATEEVAFVEFNERISSG
ncbi:hypothetical protein LguiB_028240 [Lonicera macranthoides]